MSSGKVRKLVKEYTRESPSDVYDFTGVKDKIGDIDSKVQHSFDKSIIALRIAASRLAIIIESIEENWIIHEIMMQHKIMLHSQIDVLIKEKKNYRGKSFLNLINMNLIQKLKSNSDCKLSTSWNYLKKHWAIILNQISFLQPDRSNLQTNYLGK